jgi:hypothetical protein
MRRLAIFAAAALTAFASAANASLMHQTCKQGTSTNLKFMCYVGFTESIDFVEYEYVDTRCRAQGPFFGQNSSDVHQTSLPRPTLHIYVGCPDGHWTWSAMTKLKVRTNPIPGQWVDWYSDGGDDEVFSCG